MTRTRGRPEAVDRDTLIAATLRLIDAQGIAGLTMRRLAADLGVSPMAVYRHVSSKDELLRIAASEVVRQIEVDPTGSWKSDVIAFFQIFHQRLVGHAGVAELFAGPAFLGDVVYEVAEPIFAVLLGAGFQPRSAMSLFMACAACSIGAALLDGSGQLQGDVDAFDAVRYPSIGAVIDYLPNRDPDERHSEALQGIVAGYELLMLAGQCATPPTLPESTECGQA